MKAMVIRVDEGRVEVKVIRGRTGHLYERDYSLKVGDKVEVKRQINNPYLIKVECK